MYTPIITSTGLAAWAFLQETEDQHMAALTADPQVARDTEYFLENIGSALTSDDLLADRRMLEIALTAYGLETEIDKTAFIKQVLDSGAEATSFANSLSDDRWSDLSRAFGYGDPNSGGGVSGFEAVVELAYRPDGTPDPTADDIPAADLAYFRANIGAVASADDLLADTRLLDVSLKAFGLERGYYDDEHFRQLFSEGLSQGSYATQLTNTAWISFTRAFTGLEDGAPTLSYHAFETAALREFWRLDKPPVASQETADLDPNLVSDAEFNAFSDILDTTNTADEALADATFLKVARAAFGLGDDAVSDADARAIFSAAANGDLSLAQAQSDPAWNRAGAAFLEAWSGGTAQTSSNAAHEIEIAIASRNLEALSYVAVPDNGALDISAEDLAYFQQTMPTIETSQQFVDDERLRDIALRAFGLENATITDQELRDVLDQDPTDPLATAPRLADEEAWIRFAQAYQGGAEAESARWRYELEDRLVALNAPQEDIDYLRRNWDLINANLDIVVDPRLMEIVLSAFDIEPTVGASFVTRMLVEDPTRENSFVNQVDDPRWTAFVELFANPAQGNVRDTEFQKSVVSEYHEALLRIQVGTQNESLRVAMYFEDTIGEIATMENVETLGWATVMGDEPLRRVMDAALGLPEEFVQLELEAQIPIYQQRAQTLFGGSDPSVFLDPLNVQKAIELYMVRSDVAAQSNSSSQTALTLVNQSLNFALNGFQVNVRA